MASFLQTQSSHDTGKLLLRIAVSIMLFHGTAKLAGGIAFIQNAVAGAGVPTFLAYLVYAGEVIGPILVLIGLWTRIGALLVVADMIVALTLVHRSQLFEVRPGGAWAVELPVFYFLTALAVFFLGAGRFSVSRGRGAWD